MTRVPDFDELIGRDVPAEERERLRRAHDLLLEAGPPPELPVSLERVPKIEETPSLLRRRRQRNKRVIQRVVLLAAACATAAALGFVWGHSTNPNSLSTERVVKLAGTNLRPQASATLELGKNDHGNWPMVLRVKGLKQLPSGGYYDLYLTRHGKPVVLCGTFNVGEGVTEIRLTAAYDLSHFDSNGWVVTRQLPGHHQPTDIVLQPS
jgi:hypothetical protein